MDIQNLRIEKLICHEVFKRLDDGQSKPPALGAAPIHLNIDALNALRDRISSAAGNQSQSMDMAIVDYGPESSLKIAEDLLAAQNDADFVRTSTNVANRLTSAQSSRAIPGGIISVFVGTAGNPSRSIVGYIKAELHGGFRRANNLNIEYIKTLFMTPQTKLYKIGLFKFEGPTGHPLPQGWSALVYDSHMSTANPDGAARYFFEAFLGLELPQNNARLTRLFWENTRNYIRKLDVSEEERSDLFSGLYTYVKVDQSPNLEVSQFANTYLPQVRRDEYRTFMEGEGIPLNAIFKDISEIQGSLTRRRIRFSHDVEVTGSDEAFQEFVKIETTAPLEKEEILEGERWTVITVKDRIRDQK